MSAPRHVPGLSAYYYYAAAARLGDGKITVAAQGERFTRKKNDSDFRTQAVVDYDKPVLKFTRLWKTDLAIALG